MLTLVYCALWLLCFESRARPPDTAGYYAYAQSLVLDGDLSIFRELAQWQLWRP